MKQKIMAIIYSDNGNYLLLRTNPEWLDVDQWFVVTGGIEKQDSEEIEAVKREVKEETGLDILDIKETDYVCEYEWPKDSGEMNREKAFLVKVKEDKPKLSGEHLDYKWLKKEDFKEQIYWEDAEEELNNLLID